jgi:hypothetical protein
MRSSQLSRTPYSSGLLSFNGIDLGEVAQRGEERDVIGLCHPAG